MGMPEDLNAAAIEAIGKRKPRKLCECKATMGMSPVWMPHTAMPGGAGVWVTIASCDECGASVFFKTRTVLGEDKFNEIVARHKK